MTNDYAVSLSAGMARCSGVSSSFLSNKPFTLSHKKVTVSSLINLEAFCETTPTNAFTRKLDFRNMVLFKVKGRMMRDNRETISCSKNPFVPVAGLAFGNREPIVDNNDDKLLKRLLIATLCCCSDAFNRAISARRVSIFLIGTSILVFEYFLNDGVNDRLFYILSIVFNAQ